MHCNWPIAPTVALRKESVDRNMPKIGTLRSTHKSLSARRAWIEIVLPVNGDVLLSWSLSARRAWIEICCAGTYSPCRSGSLSARRAWIEITLAACIVPSSLTVALRKESVDRNFRGWTLNINGPSRSPQGERG